MSIKEVLKKRSDLAFDDVKIELKLYNLADDLERKARAHLKRITTILTEFDIHDEKHSEKVVYNIEKLLGDERIEQLSSYELFLIHLSAFFHDCAMAPSDWEINVLKLTEGGELYTLDRESLRNDLKTPYKFSIAKEAVKNNRSKIFNSSHIETKEWMFSHSNENELLDYLAELLTDYQNFRNGFADHLKNIKNQIEFEELNNFIRIDYIRITHHTRIETYVNNLANYFSRFFEQPAWGRQLAHDLAKICRSHGEDASYITSFDTRAQYYGPESSNLQFIAIMLRLGDIIHFSYDRAPIDLRSSKLFKSEYSFQQWAIKNNGVNYSIENGVIAFRAYCETPEIYFKLNQYIDWVEVEIQNYIKFERTWQINYINKLQSKVERDNIKYNSDIFLPQRHLSFSLNQKRIIELLMGVGLYKDKFACLRELYQNSLDACRCMLAKNSSLNNSFKGSIVFGITKSEEGTYLYCADNGTGMTKDIIEKYLLNIGNSYYKSPDFFKQQANWGGGFTPTSQFGIGILSCFMIGNKIEITTKPENSDYISFSIDGPHENFYYKKTPILDKEKIAYSGTVVKIFLDDATNYKLSNCALDKLGILLLGNDEYLPKEFIYYKKYFDAWENHLYKKINSFINIIPKNIEVKVEFENGNYLDIGNKPLLSNNATLEVLEEDYEFVDYLINNRRLYPFKKKYVEIKDILEPYEIKIIHNSIEFRTLLSLPKEVLPFNEVIDLYALPQIINYGICIDGINVSNSINISSPSKPYTDYLTANGTLNFIGENRPKLSIDRTSILEYPDRYEVVAEEITELYLKEILSITIAHNNRYFTEINDNLDIIWEYIFNRIGDADVIFIKELALTKYGDIFWKGLTKLHGQEISIKDFLSNESVIINNFNFKEWDILSKRLVQFRLYSSQLVTVNNKSVFIKKSEHYEKIMLKHRKDWDNTDILVQADEWDNELFEYDIVSDYYPLIPAKLFDIITYGVYKATPKAKEIHSYSNNIVAFFKQDPLLVNVELGLYSKERDWQRKKKQNLVYDFHNKRNNIVLNEINGYYNPQQSEFIVLVVYVAPRNLTKEERRALENIRAKDEMYVKGVEEGWSILVTGKDIANTVIVAGKCTRNELVSKIPDDFWEEYKEYNFKFTDGVSMLKA